MSEIGFPIKDLTRRKQQTTLTFVGLTIATSATVFLVLFGSNLGFEISLFTQSSQLSSGFHSIFSQFIRAVSILNLVTGPIIASFLIYLIMSTRMRDIGIMKASGCLSGSVFAYFFTELSLILIFSTVAGLIFGTLSYYCSTFFLNRVGFSVSQKLDLVAVFVVAIVLVIFSHIFGALPVRKAAKAKPTDALSPIYEQESNASVGSNFPSRFGFTLKFVYRNLVRRQSTTIQAIICFTAVLTLTTVILTGGLISKETTSSYVERAIGENVVVIGHPTLTERYVALLSQFFEPKTLEELDYLDSKYAISEEFVTNLETLQGTTIVDARLVLETVVREGMGVVLDPVEQSNAILIGSNRTDTALVLGVHPEKVVNDWLFYGKKIGVNDQNVAMIGASLANNMFEDAMNQRIRVFDNNGLLCEISGTCIDPLNNGKVVYLPVETLQADTETAGYNLVFVQINSSDTEAFDELGKMASEQDFSAINLDSVVKKHTSFLNNIWSLVMFLPLFTVVTAVVALFSYITLSVSGQQHEFGIMKALGAKQKTITKIIFCQASLIILVSGLIGVSAGLFITFEFLLPDPVISTSTVRSVIITLSVILGLLCISSLYPALKTTKKTVISGLSANG
ncbi:MAG: FtsX-like permease family protein [Candidatus Bathyarchaeota archaeon]|nr:FtsX-like permease family protein [Candidatus Bathyarchaeum sp.]